MGETSAREILNWYRHEIQTLKEKRDEYERRLKDFLDYFEPRGGISDVPLGPFERAQVALGIKENQMSPDQTLNDFIADQVGWLSEFQEHYNSQVFENESLPAERTPDAWLEFFQKWQAEKIKSR